MMRSSLLLTLLLMLFACQNPQQTESATTATATDDDAPTKSTPPATPTTTGNDRLRRTQPGGEANLNYDWEVCTTYRVVRQLLDRSLVRPKKGGLLKDFLKGSDLAGSVEPLIGKRASMRLSIIKITPSRSDPKNKRSILFHDGKDQLTEDVIHPNDYVPQYLRQQRFDVVFAVPEVPASMIEPFKDAQAVEVYGTITKIEALPVTKDRIRRVRVHFKDIEITE